VSQKSVEVVMAFHVAYNARDLDRALSLCTDDVMLYPDRSLFPEAESVAGPNAVRGFLEETWAAWTTGAVTPREMQDLGRERVLVRSDWDGRGSASGAAVTTNLSAIYTVRDRAIASAAYYFYHAEALTAVARENVENAARAHRCLESPGPPGLPGDVG
jgi:ketosteroid isomerase-like protein